MRYARHSSLNIIGKNGQKKLEKSKVCIVGLGATGSRTAELLARMGVGELIVIDRDYIELNNLQRQTLYSEEDIGKFKSDIALIKLKSINSGIKLKSFNLDIDYENIDVIKSDLVLDCTDNFYTRFLINDYCKKNNIPWIYSSAIRCAGMVFDIMPKGPCFRCLFNEPTKSLGTCEIEGILGSLPSAISSIQATEAIKILINKDYSKELIYYNAWNNEITKIKINKKKNCLVCNGIYEYLSGNKHNLIKLCGSNSYQIKGKISMDRIKNIKYKKINDILQFDDITLMKNGMALVKANNEKEAKKKYEKYFG